MANTIQKFTNSKLANAIKPAKWTAKKDPLQKQWATHRFESAPTRFPQADRGLARPEPILKR